MNEKVFSVIIPHKNSIQYLSTLLASIPAKPDIEIIIIDNSQDPIQKEQVVTDRTFKLLYSDSVKGAGRARNVGIDNSTGKWLIFADADDFFTDNAFDIFYSQQDSTSDIIYFCMGGMYVDTGEPSPRGDVYAKLVRSFINNPKTERDLRYRFASPCCKMVRRQLVQEHDIRYDEILAGNDQYFSLVSGYYAKKVTAIDEITYIATVSRGSLTQRRDYEVIEARLYSKLHYNQFLRTHGIKGMQQSVLFPFIDGKYLGVKCFLKFIYMIFRFRQNPFIGVSRWFSTYIKVLKKNDKESAYITK